MGYHGGDHGLHSDSPPVIALCAPSPSPPGALGWYVPCGETPGVPSLRLGLHGGKPGAFRPTRLRGRGRPGPVFSKPRRNKIRACDASRRPHGGAAPTARVALLQPARSVPGVLHRPGNAGPLSAPRMHRQATSPLCLLRRAAGVSRGGTRGDGTRHQAQRGSRTCWLRILFWDLSQCV
jgi:hypothetical protein